MSNDYGFGYKTAWFTIHGDDPKRIASILKIKGAKPASWEQGMAKACKDGGVFISKPVQGWTFVVAIDLMGASEDPETLGEQLKELSKADGEAQYFVSYRVADGYGWAKAVNGKMIRAYLNVQGEVHWNEGKLTPAEKELGLDNPELYVNEETVLEIAAKWGINPSILTKKTVTDPTGLAGKLK